MSILILYRDEYEKKMCVRTHDIQIKDGLVEFDNGTNIMVIPTDRIIKIKRKSEEGSIIGEEK